MTDLDEVHSARTAGDSWDITESVGATALSVAAARAVETAAADPLIRDEFVRTLVSSAGPAWARPARPDLEWLDGDQHGQQVHWVGCDYQAVRTHFFDEYFGAATRDGIRQAVILAAGLDSRAYRLPADAQDRLFEMLTALSVPGSQVAVESFSLDSAGNPRRRAARRARWTRMRERLGLDVNVETLTHNETDRADAVQWLADHGWQVHAVSNADEMARLARYPKTWSTRRSPARWCERDQHAGASAFRRGQLITICIRREREPDEHDAHR